MNNIAILSHSLCKFTYLFYPPPNCSCSQKVLLKAKLGLHLQRAWITIAVVAQLWGKLLDKQVSSNLWCGAVSNSVQLAGSKAGHWTLSDLPPPPLPTAVVQNMSHYIWVSKCGISPRAGKLSIIAYGLLAQIAFSKYGYIYIARSCPRRTLRGLDCWFQCVVSGQL